MDFKKQVLPWIIIAVSGLFYLKTSILAAGGVMAGFMMNDSGSAGSFGIFMQMISVLSFLAYPFVSLFAWVLTIILFLIKKNIKALLMLLLPVAVGIMGFASVLFFFAFR